MKIKEILNPNCSEAVFRFHTTNPKKMQFILRTIANEINSNTDFDGHKNQKIPLYKKAKQYEKGVLLECCAGLGDNNAVIKVNETEDYFTLNIGNNDISPNTTGWTDTILSMGIQVEEAEFDDKLKEISRDCTCGITYFK